MKTFVLACSLGAILMSGAAYAADAQQPIGVEAIAQGNDRSGGMRRNAIGASGSLAAQRPVIVGSVPADRQWSHLRSRQRRAYGDAY